MYTICYLRIVATSIMHCVIWLINNPKCNDAYLISLQYEFHGLTSEIIKAVLRCILRCPLIYFQFG